MGGQHDPVAERFAKEAEDHAKWFGPTLTEAIARVVAEMEDPPQAIPTGLSKLDGMLTGGLRAGEVMVVAARPSVGKSAFTLQVLLHAARRGHPVVLWSLEMSPEQWLRRAISFKTGIAVGTMKQGNLNDTLQDRIRDATTELFTLPLFFGGTWTEPKAVRTQAAYHVDENSAQLLVIDYLQLMDPPEGAHSRENEVAATSRAIKRIALDYGVAVLLVAQLNRNAEGRAPTMADLRESGAVEQDADMIFFLHRERDPDTHILSDHALGILAKNRDGETGTVAMQYDRARFRFLQLMRDVA